MIDTNEISRDVSFNGDFRSSDLSLNEHYSFLQLGEVDGGGVLRLLGFSALIQPMLKYDEIGTAHSVTDLADLPKSVRTIDKQGKGVGVRMYNIPQVLAGVGVAPNQSGAFSFAVREDNLLDYRGVQGGKAAQFSRHLGRIVSSKLGDLDSVVNGIHDDYQELMPGVEIDAVELKVPMHPLLREKKLGVENPKGIIPSFMIIRNSDIEIAQVGRVR